MDSGDDGMDCNETLREIYSYLDGELTVWKRRAIARHLDECPPCSDGYTFEVELRQVIVSRCQEEVPESLRRRVAEALGDVAPPPSPPGT